jgi:hypothetical protein
MSNVVMSDSSGNAHHAQEAEKDQGEKRGEDSILAFSSTTLSLRERVVKTKVKGLA